MIRFIGDVHGKYKWYKNILKESPHPTVQVGDMGVGFVRYSPFSDREQYLSNPPYDLMVEHKARFIRGNHDNPSVCKKHTQWIPDGHVEGDMMFVGGAVSIDRAYRTEGIDYWSDEELSWNELEEIRKKYIEYRPRIMVTHECPQTIAEEVCRQANRGVKLDPQHSSRTRQTFAAMWAEHQPEYWIFGHWHHPIDLKLNGTNFICLAELETIDIEEIRT
jgi:predicted phosphodiesterase